MQFLGDFVVKRIIIYLAIGIDNTVQQNTS